VTLGAVCGYTQAATRKKRAVDRSRCFPFIVVFPGRACEEGFVRHSALAGIEELRTRYMARTPQERYWISVPRGIAGKTSPRAHRLLYSDRKVAAVGGKRSIWEIDAVEESSCG
jgi:hypothetical protein